VTSPLRRRQQLSFVSAGRRKPSQWPLPLLPRTCRLWKSAVPSESGLIHFCAFSDGTVHFTGTLRGTFSADALPTDAIPDPSGTFVHWFGAAVCSWQG
jgi:hypothetical protein